MTWKSINQELRDKNLVRSRRPPATSLSRTTPQCQTRPAEEVLIEADPDWERIEADTDWERIEQDTQQPVVPSLRTPL
jgi:hypothetical protein